MKKTLLLMSIFTLTSNLLAMEAEVKIDDNKEAIITVLNSKGANIDPSDIVSAEYVKDNTQIITGHKDGTAIIWNAETGEKLHELKPSRSTVTSVQISADGKTITTTDQFGITHTLDAETGEEIVNA